MAAGGAADLDEAVVDENVEVERGIGRELEAEVGFESALRFDLRVRRSVRVARSVLVACPNASGRGRGRAGWPGRTVIDSADADQAVGVVNPA